MDKIKIHKCWESRGNKLYLESMKGYHDTKKWGRGDHFEDRRFMLRINGSESVAFTHEMQLEIMKRVLNNDALPHVFHNNCSKFENAIHKLKNEREEKEIEINGNMY
tara:strand:+ start:281 stop:601 length:321 start_codon:yes stop_codon:yes gene_type:complete